MTILKADAKGLEIVCVAYLSQDKVLMKELIDGVDIHGENQKVFGLPSRLVAKVFVFRLIYGGSAYSYSVDPDFTNVSTSENYWQKVIDKFYQKYTGIRDWHTKIIQEAMTTGQLIMPTGRVYKFEPKRNKRGELETPDTIIKNYPVQGLGADLMSIVRVSFYRRFKHNTISGFLVNTVHDDIVCDIVPQDQQRVVDIFHSVFNDIPSNFNRVFGKKFNLPLKCEISVGNNMKDLNEI